MKGAWKDKTKTFTIGIGSICEPNPSMCSSRLYGLYFRVVRSFANIMASSFFSAG